MSQAKEDALALPGALADRRPNNLGPQSVFTRVSTHVPAHTRSFARACARTRTRTPGPEMGPEEVISHTLRRLRINNEPYLDSGVEVIMLLSLTLRYRYFTTLITMHVQLLLRLASYILTLIHY